VQVQSLEAFGVHRDLLRAWEDSYSEEPLPAKCSTVPAWQCMHRPERVKPLWARWQQCTRPPRGVLVGPVCRYQEHNTGTIGQEDLGIDIAEANFGGAVLAVTLQLTAQGEPTLVFVKDRRNSVWWAYRLAERLHLPPAQQAIEQLFILSPTPTRRRRDAAHQNRISLPPGCTNPADVVY